MGSPGVTPASVKLLIFGVDGVLFHYDRAARVRALGDELGVSADGVWAAFFTSGIEDRGDIGELSTDDYLAALSHQLGVTVPRDAWVRARAAAMTPDFDVLGLAARACRTVPVAALSNNPALLKEEAPRIAPELSALVRDRLFVGGELGVATPHPTAYWAVTDRCGVPPARSLFVDEIDVNVTGARDAGLEAHRFTTAASLESCLTAYGLLPAPGDPGHPGSDGSGKRGADHQGGAGYSGPGRLWVRGRPRRRGPGR